MIHRLQEHPRQPTSHWPFCCALALAAIVSAAGGCCSRPGIRVHGDCSLELGPPTGEDCDKGSSTGHCGSGGMSRVLPPPVDSGTPAVSPDARFHPVPTRPVFAPKPTIEPSPPKPAPEPVPMPAEPDADSQALRAKLTPIAPRARPLRSIWVEPASSPRRNNGRPERRALHAAPPTDEDLDD